MQFEDLHKGLTRSFEVRISEAMIDSFAELSEDKNSLHMDASVAGRHGFPHRVSHGMLTASFYSTLVGMHIPGENALLHGMDIHFTKPVFPGDTLTITGVVSDVNEVYGRIEIKARVTNQDGTLVSRAKIRTGLLND
jgi:acyl dehydratase